MLPSAAPLPPPLLWGGPRVAVHRAVRESNAMGLRPSSSVGEGVVKKKKKVLLPCAFGQSPHVPLCAKQLASRPIHQRCSTSAQGRRCKSCIEREREMA